MDSEHTEIPPTGRATSQENWQVKVDRLQEIVCMLLMKNQGLRMALSTEREKRKNAGSVSIVPDRLSMSSKSPNAHRPENGIGKSAFVYKSSPPGRETGYPDE
jgi:hypothetical protein